MHGQCMEPSILLLHFYLILFSCILQQRMRSIRLLQASGKIWRPAQQVICTQGKSMAFCCRGKNTEITPVTDDLLLP
jgi:hypothetical protein